jgi:hypothetical protein
MIKNFMVDVALGIICYLVIFYVLLCVGAPQSREAASLAAATASVSLAMLVNLPAKKSEKRRRR